MSDASGVDQAIFSSKAEPKTDIALIPTLKPEVGSQIQTEPGTPISDEEKDETARMHFEIQTEHRQPKEEPKEEPKVNVNGLAPSAHGVQEESTHDQLTVLASKHDIDNAGTDIEKIVNLLETVPQPVASDSSNTINTALDLQEIPDEGTLI